MFCEQLQIKDKLTRMSPSQYFIFKHISVHIMIYMFIKYLFYLYIEVKESF